MRLCIAQVNPTVGDVAGNARLIVSAIHAAKQTGADLVLLSELCLCGYPPKDLLFQAEFVRACELAAGSIAQAATGLTAIVGLPMCVSPDDAGAGVTNSLLALRDGAVVARYDKRLLPTYDVFDEDRYFVPGDKPVVIDVAGLRVGLSVCEDLWRGEDAGVAARYRSRRDPVADLVEAGAQLIVNPSASPFVLGKGRRHRAILTDHVRRHGVALAAVNQLGGNDELIFDGHAAVYVPDNSDASGARLIAAGPGFRECVIDVDIASDSSQWASIPGIADPRIDACAEELLWKALTLGAGDYCRKTGFKSVVFGLSGGIDSTLTACIAAGALGPENVLCVSMPSRYSSDHSLLDAQDAAERMGIRLVNVPIESPHAAVEAELRPVYDRLGADPTAGLAEENVQSRLRGLTVMALSNKLGHLALTTGNKSELAVGYATLYGDMSGGLAVLSDLTKMQVYALSRWINEHHDACGFSVPPIPERVLTKPPSAELRPDQFDQDTLPPYEALDAIVERYVERRHSPGQIVRETGINAGTVEHIVRMIDRSEYKRRQAAIGLKVTDIAFGTGRRMPIAQRWRPDNPEDPSLTI